MGIADHRSAVCGPAVNVAFSEIIDCLPGDIKTNPSNSAIPEIVEVSKISIPERIKANYG